MSFPIISAIKSKEDFYESAMENGALVCKPLEFFTRSPKRIELSSARLEFTM